MPAIKARDIVIEIATSALSQQESDGVPSYDADVTYTCLCTSYSREDSYSSEDLAAIGDIYTQKYVTRRESKLELEFITDSQTGTEFQARSGFYVKVTATLPFGTGTQTIVDEGVVVNSSMSVDLDGIVTEKISVQLGAYGVMTPTVITTTP